MSLKWYSLASFIFTQVAGQSPTYRLKGQNVTWKPTLTYQPDDILWKHKGNKVVEFNGQENFEFGQHQGRIILGWDSADLTIRDLRYEDSGDYELEVSRQNKDFLRFPYKLEVIDKVAKPTISCEMDDGSDLKNSAMLVCSAESRQTESLMKYEWRSHGTVQPGQNLTIPLGETHDDHVYSCTVSNPLSDETATFTAKDCYSNESSTVALIAALVIILIIILLVFGLVLFLKQRRKACFAERKTQSLPQGLEESVSQNAPPPDRAPTRRSNQPLHQPDHMEEPQLDEKPQKGDVKKKAKIFEESIKAQNAECVPLINKQSPDKPGAQNAAKASAYSVKGKNADSENQSPPQITEDFDKNKDKDKNSTPSPSSAPSESPSPDAGQPEGSAEEKEEEYPAGVSEMESSAAPEQPESKKESDEDKEPVSPSVKGSRPAPLPEDTPKDRTELASLDQVNGETFRDDSMEAETSTSSPERKDSETSLHEQDEDKDKMDKSASAVENESDSEGDGELKDKEDLYLAASEEHQSPSPAKPDNSTIKESADTAQADPDQEEKGKTRHESSEGEGKIVEDKKVQN